MCVHPFIDNAHCTLLGVRPITQTTSPTFLVTMFRTLLAALIACSCSLSAQTTFTSSGTFVVPPGVENMTVELVGPGGNGASNGGGGGGAFASAVYEVIPGTNYSVVVGTGGSGLATSISALGIAAGAGGNATTTPNPNIGGGGQGGVAQGGDVNRNGGTGGGGYYTYFGGGGGGAAGPSAAGGVGGNTIVWNGSNCLTPGGAAGIGGGAPAGDGGKGAGFTDANCTVTDPGANGGAYGGGGGGGNGIGSAFGIGGGGYCRITWNTSTGVDQQTAAATPQLLQNPITDRIALRQPLGTEQYALLDATGRTIWSGQRIDLQDFSNLRTGAYFLRVAVGDKVSVLRLVK